MAFDIVPHYFSSDTPEGLRLEILEYQLRKGVQVQVLNIIFAKNKFYAFYYDRAQEVQEIPRGTNGNIS